VDSSFLGRVRRVLTLDASVYGEVAADTQSTGQAVLVVIAVAFAQGVGEGGGGGASRMLVGVAEGCLGWALWFVAIHIVARALGIASELGALFRAVGFAAAPFALGALRSLPVLGTLFWAAEWVLGVAVFVLAVRRVLALETYQALLVCLGGLVLAFVLAAPLAWIFPG
jgi:hypothetical protein